MSQRFDFNSTPLQGLYRIEHKPFKDQRGFFSRLFCAEEFKEVGLVKSITQRNHTLTKSKGTVRGIHFQYPPHLIAYVVDKNPAKQKKYMPGSRIPIKEEQYLKNNNPDYIIILPWNLKREVMSQLDYVKERGGSLLLPFLN